MRKQRKQFLLIGLVVVMTLTSLIILGLRGNTQYESPLTSPIFRSPPPVVKPIALEGVQVPEAVMRCVAETGDRLDLLGVAKEKNKSFYLLGIADDSAIKNPLLMRDELIALGDKLGCLRLISTDIPQPLSVFLSIATARELELQRYRRWISRLGSKQEFEQALSSQLAFGGSYLSAEQVWALQQLRVRFPKTYELLRPNTFGDGEALFRKGLLEKY